MKFNGGQLFWYINDITQYVLFDCIKLKTFLETFEKKIWTHLDFKLWNTCTGTDSSLSIYLIFEVCVIMLKHKIYLVLLAMFTIQISVSITITWDFRDIYYERHTAIEYKVRQIEMTNKQFIFYSYSIIELNRNQLRLPKYKAQARTCDGWHL